MHLENQLLLNFHQLYPKKNTSNPVCLLKKMALSLGFSPGYGQTNTMKFPKSIRQNSGNFRRVELSDGVAEGSLELMAELLRLAPRTREINGWPWGSRCFLGDDVYTIYLVLWGLFHKPWYGVSNGCLIRVPFFGGFLWHIIAQKAKYISGIYREPETFVWWLVDLI